MQRGLNNIILYACCACCVFVHALYVLAVVCTLLALSIYGGKKEKEVSHRVCV